jgi:hypothetical protein
MAHRSLVLGSVLLLGLTLGLTAQIPSGTKYVASSFGGQAGNAIVTFDSTGAITSIIPLASATSPAAIVMGKRNDEMLVFDSNRLHQIHVITGAQNYTTYQGPSTTGGLLDEDAGLVWCTSQGLLLKANDLSCTQLYTITYMPNHRFQTVGQNGSTGDYVVSAQDQTNQQWQLFTIDSNGAILQTLTGMPRITGLDWSPWSGHMYASFDTGNGGVLRIDSTGQVTTLPLPLTPATAGLASVEVREQPYEELVATEGGTDPQHVLVLDLKGSLTSFHTSKGRFAPSDLAILGQRPLWATTPWNVGHLAELSVQFGPAHASEYYQVALSFGHGPGIPVPGRGTIHLTVDALFQTSFQIGSPTFGFFAGKLDKDGKAPIDPQIFIPDLTVLIGTRIYGGAVTFNATGITEVSNCWGVTLRWT